MILLLLNVSIDSLLNQYGIEHPGFEWSSAWSRFPAPEYIPFTLPFFTDLYKDPLYTYRFSRGMADVIEHYLTDSILDGKHSSLYNILYFGVDVFVKGFRNYGSNLVKRKLPLIEAIRIVIEKGQKQANTFSFGGEYDEEDPLKEKIKSIPDTIQTILSDLVMNVVDGMEWIERAWRNVPDGTKGCIFNIKDLDLTISGGSRYYQEIDDADKFIDYPSLMYGILKIADAVEKAGFSLKGLKKTQLIDKDIVIWTPYGEIAILGKGSGTHSFHSPFIIVDLGGNDTYTGMIAGTSGRTPVSVLIETGGDDKYVSEDTLIQTQGAGICGVGILLDMDGNDTYKGGKQSQGYGLFGAGILADLSGNDKYTGWTQTQGCGYRGIGILIDASGNDKYYSYGNSQGDGEIGGIGILGDRIGDDHYYAEPYSSVYNRGDYHSKKKINANNSQGFGGGRRADGSDGHSWAGGLGMLIDIAGNDEYISGNWSQGTGYWFGTGILYDREGNDHYKSCYFTQGSGAHYCIGALIDENGNDHHELFETAGAALGFGWDWAFALLYDGGGNDIYNEKRISIGVGEIRSIALFIEAGGNDQYILSEKGLRCGACDNRDSYYRPKGFSPYNYYGKNIGVFLDCGGNDKYSAKDFGNDTVWFHPEPDSINLKAKNIGIGIDGELKGFKWK